MMEILVGAAFLAIAIGIRLWVGSLDTGRIEAYVKRQGWTLEDRSWDPLGPGCLGERDSRIYLIVFRDQEGNLRRANVKTSWLSGVYLTQDEIIERPPVPPRAGLKGEDLDAENERLRKRAETFEKRLRQSGK